MKLCLAGAACYPNEMKTCVRPIHACFGHSENMKILWNNFVRGRCGIRNLSGVSHFFVFGRHSQLYSLIPLEHSRFSFHSLGRLHTHRCDVTWHSEMSNRMHRRFSIMRRKCTCIRYFCFNDNIRIVWPNNRHRPEPETTYWISCIDTQKTKQCVSFVDGCRWLFNIMA